MYSPPNSFTENTQLAQVSLKLLKKYQWDVYKIINFVDMVRYVEKLLVAAMTCRQQLSAFFASNFVNLAIYRLFYCIIAEKSYQNVVR
jgi:hypothetical protein